MSENNRSFSSSITLTRVADGTSADSIIVELPYEEILRFVTADNNDQEVVQFSPENFIFRVFNVQSNHYITGFNWGLYYLNDKQEYSVVATKENKGSFKSAFSEITPQGGKMEAVKLDLNKFYEILSADNNFTYLKGEIDKGSAFFKFVYIDGSNQPAALGFFAIRNGMSNEMAQMVIGVNSIGMAVRDSSLKFSADGLALVNGDFAIYKTEIEEGDEIFYADDQGNLVLKGVIYANAGQFHGDVYAENGSFNGSIKATDGDIGGFQIVANSYSEVNKNSNAEKNAGLYYLLDEGLGVYRYISVKDNEHYISVVYDSNKNYYQKFNGTSFIDGVKYYELNSNSSGYNKTSDGSYNSSKTYYTIRQLKYLDSLGGQEATSPQNGTIYYIKLDLSNTSTLYKGNGAQLSSANNSIILNGTEGKIIAENIELGSGAKVTGKIEFANSDSDTASAVLYNPAINDNLFLETSQVKLYSDGKLKLGTIELFGGTGINDGYIRSLQIDQNQQTQNGEWRINEDGTAYFDNIYANNVHIQNSVLEIDTIQSVGSTMIFKDAWTIESLSKTKNTYSATLDGLANLNADDYFISDNETFFKVVSISNDETTKKSSITFNLISSNDNGISRGSIITKFGQAYDEANHSSGYVISIRGEESLKGSQTFSSGNALTISSFKDINGDIQYTKHLILGDLSDSGIDDLTDVYGYGLYADNVYLNGSLITRDIENGYCGINTISKAQFTKNSALDDSPIIFWGGARGKTTEAIQEAPFQVTANGTLFCKNAMIEQSTFTGEIHTAKIYGNGDSTPSLAILDAEKGIGFLAIQEDYDSSTGAVSPREVEVFSMGSKGFHTDGNYFITLEKDSIPLFSGILSSSDTGFTTSYNGKGVYFESDGYLRQNIEAGNYEIDDSGDQNTTSGVSQILLGFKDISSQAEDGGDNEVAVAVFEKTRIKNSVKTLFDKEIYQGLVDDKSYIMWQALARDVNNTVVGYDIYIG